MNQYDLNRLLLKTASYDGVMKENSLDELKKLLALGADINVKDDKGKNLLSVFCTDAYCKGDYTGDCKRYVEYLIDSKVDVNSRDLHDRTPIFSGSFVNTLLRAGAKVNVTNYIGDTPLTHVICNEFSGRVINVVNTFIENGADVNYVNVDGMTPLMHAVHKLSWTHLKQTVVPIVRMLIEAGADLYIKNKEGETFDSISRQRYKNAVSAYKGYNWYMYEYRGKPTIEAYKSIIGLSERADIYYKNFDDQRERLFRILYDCINLFPTELVTIVMDYAVLTIKDFLSDT